MRIKDLIVKCLPSFRARDAIIAELSVINQKMDCIEKRIDQADSKNEYFFWYLNRLENETELDTKRRVFLDMPKTKGETREFQIVSNYILKRVKKVCDENDIHLMLYYGTLLGAVRHNGFIPWDDDVDIAALRKDYNKMFDVINRDSELVMKRYYHYSNNNPGYIAKIKLKNSDNFYIDVFSWDFIDVQEENEQVIQGSVQKLSQDFHNELATIFEKYGHVSKRVSRPETYEDMDSAVIALENKYLTQFSNDFISNENSSHICLGIEQELGSRDEETFRECAIFLPIQPNSVIFEGEKYDSFSKPEQMLQYNYGDIWQFPKGIEPIHSAERKKYTQFDKNIIKTLMKEVE